MNEDAVRFAMAAMVTSICDAVTLATGKPVGKFAGHLIREIADTADQEAKLLCAFLALCAEGNTNNPQLGGIRQSGEKAN